MAHHNLTSSSDYTNDGFSQGLAMSLPEHSTCLQAKFPSGKRVQSQVLIDRLPDNVLLEIFDFCRPSEPRDVTRLSFLLSWSRSWKMLTQVCRRWRYIILESPRRLHLRVLYTPTTPMTMSLDIWPPFPISICCAFNASAVDERNVENLTTALEHRDRISEIYILNITGPGLERLIGAMHKPLPALTHFYLRSTDKSVLVLPETFLGGSALHLQWFDLKGIPFPSLPKFIMSATNIVYLAVLDIPDSGCISPNVMVTCLAALPNLKYLGLGFRSPLSRPLQVGLPPLHRTVLPALVNTFFQGASEYFEDFLARTHIPLLMWLDMRFFMDLIFDIPRTYKLIDRTKMLGLLGHAWVMFGLKRIRIELGSRSQVKLDILCEERDWQLSSLAHVCHQHLPLSSVEQLTVCELDPDTTLRWKDDMDSSQWLELFHPFVAVRDLYVAKQLVPFVAATLQELTGGRSIEVLPVLNNLFLEEFEPSGPTQEAIKLFFSARELSDHPIVIHSDPPPRPLRPPP